jgi:hypothetical protein
MMADDAGTPALCPCGVTLPHDGARDDQAHEAWARSAYGAWPAPTGGLRRPADGPPPGVAMRSAPLEDSPGWRDLNGLQKGMALVMSAVALAIVIPLLVLAGAGIVKLWEWVF